MTKTYAVVGDPIDHSLSPSIHNAAFKKLEMDCTYIAYRIPRGELKEGIEAIKTIKIAGFNVTVPHKIEMIKYLDDLDENCKLIGATNTVANEGNKLIGYNTDIDGFLEPIIKRNFKINGSNVLLLGAGGAARAIVAGLARNEIQKISIANRTKEKGNILVDFANKLGMVSEGISFNQLTDLPANYDLIVNASSIGLKNEPSPISSKTIAENVVVYDIVYMPMNTDLIKKSKLKGAKIIYGYEMLLSQAAKSFEIWHKIKAPYEEMKKVLVGGF